MIYFLWKKGNFAFCFDRNSSFSENSNYKEDFYILALDAHLNWGLCMKIVVEGAVVELDLPAPQVTLKEVIDEVEDFLFNVGKIPTSLEIDRVCLTQDDLNQRQKEILTGKEHLEFGVMGIVEFVIDNLEGAGHAHEELIGTIRKFAENIHRLKDQHLVHEMMNELNYFFDFWTKLNGLLPEQFQGLSVGVRKVSFEESLFCLQNILEESLKAMEGLDFVLAADLLQYEALDLIQGINNLIPDLQQRIKTFAEANAAQESSKNS